MIWHFRETHPTFFDVTCILLVVMNCDLNVQSQKITTDQNKTTLNTNLDNYPLEAILLAQEDAKCLQEFGSRPNKTLEYNLFVPFICIKGSRTYSQCDQCRKLTTHVRSSEECETFCGNSDSDYCRTKCIRILEAAEELQNTRNSFEGITTTDNNSKQLESPQNDSPMVYKPKKDYRKDSISFRKFGVNDNPSSPGLLETPKIFCEDVVPPKTKSALTIGNSSPNSIGLHIVYLTWNLRNKSGVEKNISSCSEERLSVKSSGKERDLPIVFVLEQLSSDDRHWTTLGKKFTGLEPVIVPYKAQKFKWRVTAVGPNGILDTATSEELLTVDGYLEPGPPKRIFVAKEEVCRLDLVDVLIGWDPPAERPCGFKIMLHPLLDTQKAKTSRHNEPLGVHLQWFKGLKFNGIYDVIITSRTSNPQFESTLTSQNLTIISCLAAYQNRFDKCEPPAPTDISHQILIFHRGDTEGKEKVRVKLNWLPPAHTSRTNPIENYTVSLGPTYNETGHNQSLSGATYYHRHVVPGSLTHLYLGELIANTQYAVTLYANSTKGRSPPAQYILSTKLGRNEDFKSSINNWFYLSIPMSVIVIAIFGCHFLRMFFQKRQVKLARIQYFQSMEERDALSCDWSIVPLDQDSPSFKLLNDFPKEKWEISSDNLIMGEIIGQGAFGVVRRAKMARKTLQAVARKYHNLFPNENLDADGMETVAVKMLKVAATRDDRDQLIKEIVTMQNLGYQPQIVSLLGACTKGRSLCLVLEYCPGGDLLTFLRKVRAKYWPMLGLSGAKRSRSSESSIKSESTGIMLGGESEATSASSCRKSTDSCSLINYADIGGFSNHSSDQIFPSTATTVEHEYLNSKTVSNFVIDAEGKSLLNQASSIDDDNDCRPIDEKDVLSYARQIAIGMEYLEKNRVVHRDLASRNVLLLGDYKQVKISDFGLSRDIYTWNVYHQKSNGKLPIKWMAIESIFTHVFTSKSDVWSYGILLWELVTLGGTPYPGLGNTELFQQLKSGYRMERPDNCSEELYALMKKCWRTAPASRPNFTELHRYLETMLEAAEPNLYLSLMADLPTDYFHLGSSSDLHHMNLHDESPTCENSRQSHLYPNNQTQTQPSSRHNSFQFSHGHGRTGSTSTSGGSNAQHKNLGLNRSHSNPYQHRHTSTHSTNSKNQYHPRQPSLPKKTKVNSPDSGIHRDPGDYVNENENENDSNDISHPLSPFETQTQSPEKDVIPIPLRVVNNMTIIENRTYDITDL